VAPSVVSACLGGADGGASRAALDAGEVGAVSEDPNQNGQHIALSDLAGLFNMLNRACGELSDVKKELKDVTSMQGDLRLLCNGQDRMERTISDIQRDHKDAIKNMNEHDKDIIKLSGSVELQAKDIQQLQETVKEKGWAKDTKELQTTVKGLQDDTKGILIKMAAVAGGVSVAIWVVAQGIAMYDKLPHGSGKVGSIMPPVLTRGRG
jgi:uncharacterized protein (UPF0335 family)